MNKTKFLLQSIHSFILHSLLCVSHCSRNTLIWPWTQQTQFKIRKRKGGAGIPKKRLVASWILSSTRSRKRAEQDIIKFYKTAMNTSVVTVITKSPSSLILLHRKESTSFPLKSELSDYFNNKVPQKWHSASDARQAQASETSSFLFLSLETFTLGTQLPCSPEAQATCRCPCSKPSWRVTEGTTKWHQPESSQGTSLSSRGSRHGGTETNHPCFTLAKILTAMIWDDLLHSSRWLEHS